MEISSQLLSPRFWVEYALDFGAREPAHLTIELLCIGLIGYLIFSKQYKPNEIKPLSRKEEDAIIADWTPEPMVPETFQNNHSTDPFLIVDSSADAVVTSEGKEYLNLASHNFLGFANNQMIKDKCAETINKYGVGSCGPRGFYGTLPPHSELERTFANFLGVSDSILYSDSMACMSSVIPAFAKTGDIIVSDEHVNNGIQCGLKLSRSRICFFKHNDLADLEKLLADIADKAERATNKTRAETHRRFITIEGIYQYTGSVTNLKAVVALAKKYRFRIILDDTLALGVLGATGRGSCEHWGVSIGDDVAIVCASLDAAVASVGGLCVGSPAIVSHQRLSGSGYCFSASSTPYSATAGSLGLGLINANPQLPALARSRAEFLRQQLRSVTSSLPLVLSGDAESPVTHVRLGAAWPYDASASGSGSPTAASTAAAGADNTAAAMAVLWRVAERLKEEGIIAVPATYLPTETLCPPPSLRLCVSTHHAEEDLVAAAKAIGKAFAAELQRK